jgi:hypothetical protein
LAAAELPVPPPPKVRSGAATIPSFLKSAKQSADVFLPQDDLRLANLDIETLRNTERATPALLRKLAKASPDLSAAVFSAVRMAVSGHYLAVARDLDGALNPEGTRLAQQLCRRFDFLGPFEGGFNDFPGIRAAAESIGREMFMLGAGAVELVLGKSRLPEGLSPISIETIKFKIKGRKRIPFQVVGDSEVSLDIPTFFYRALDQDLRTPYAESPLQSALQPVQASQAFMNDLRRVFRRAIHPRVMAKIKEEMWRKNVPPDILHDPNKLAEFMNATIASIQSLLDGLAPEDAVVLFDTLDLSLMTTGNTSLSDEYKVLSQILNGKLSAGAKAMPVILGHDAAGSTNIASTQSMLYVKTVEGAIQQPLNELFSRLLTTAVRLFGVEAVVEFAFEPVDLRPALELETFKAVRQSRTLELNSLGYLTDEETSLELTRSLPPLGMTPLMGTYYHKAAPVSGNATSNTSAGQGSALNQTLKPDTPTGVKSKEGGR